MPRAEGVLQKDQDAFNGRGTSANCPRSQCQADMAREARYAKFSCPAGLSMMARIEMPKNESATKSTNAQNATCRTDIEYMIPLPHYS